MDYRVHEQFSIWAGFGVDADHVLSAAKLTNGVLAALPASLYRSLDFKTTSAIVGSIFCESIAGQLDAIVNPIE
jgi:hypothetical protein